MLPLVLILMNWSPGKRLSIQIWGNWGVGHCGPRRILTEKPISFKRLTILAWNNYWRWPDFGIGEGNQGFISHNCSYTNCFLRVDVTLSIRFKSNTYSAENSVQIKLFLCTKRPKLTLLFYYIKVLAHSYPQHPTLLFTWALKWGTVWTSISTGLETMDGQSWKFVFY